MRGRWMVVAGCNHKRTREANLVDYEPPLDDVELSGHQAPVQAALLHKGRSSLLSLDVDDTPESLASVGYIAQIAPVGIFGCLPSGQLTHANNQLYDLGGLAKSAALPMTIMQCCLSKVSDTWNTV